MTRCSWSARMPNRNKIYILGVGIDPIRVDELHRHILDFVISKRHARILNVNVHCLNLASRTLWLQQMLNSAEIVFCDGAGVILGARILGQRIPQRITYADWIWQLAALCERERLSLFFLGARPGVADKAAARLLAAYPKLNIAGIQHGFFDKAQGSAQNNAVIAHINRVRPNILIVAFGMPLQERWLLENWEFIDADVALTAGAVFDYASGETRRAPRWMTNSGLEWLGRLVIEPRRLWRRYLVGNTLFLWRVLRVLMARLRGS